VLAASGKELSYNNSMPKPTKEERLAHDTMQREEIHEIRMRNMRAVNDVIEQSEKVHPDHQKEYMPGNAGDVHPDDRVYPDHDKIIEWMMDLVGGSIEAGRECMHAREILDDVIADLGVLRNALATPEQYHEKGLL